MMYGLFSLWSLLLLWTEITDNALLRRTFTKRTASNVFGVLLRHTIHSSNRGKTYTPKVPFLTNRLRGFLCFDLCHLDLHFPSRHNKVSYTRTGYTIRRRGCLPFY